MQLCPVSIMIGCKACPIVKACPGKSIIGNYNAGSSKKSAKPSGASKPK